MFKKFINWVFENTVNETVDRRWSQLTDEMFDEAYESEILPVVSAFHSRESVSAVNFVEIAKWMESTSIELEDIKNRVKELQSNSTVQLHSPSEITSQPELSSRDVESKFSEIFNDLESLKNQLAVVESTCANPGARE